MTAPAISVAMATYNGLPYLKEQVASIFSQSVLPTEVVVCDDQSTDGTWEYLQELGADDRRIVLHRNPQRLGSTRNFERAIGFCTGDVIFLSDQDDVWLPDKIEQLAGELARRGAVLAMSNGWLVAEDGSLRGQSLWEANRIDPPVASALQSVSASEVLARRAYLTGSALCFAASLKDAVLPIPGRVWHDQWIGLMASLARPGHLVLLDRCLYHYRQHGGNQVGAGDLRSLARVRAEVSSHRDLQRHVDFCKAAIDRIRSGVPRSAASGNAPAVGRVLTVLEHAMRHAQARCAYIEGLRPWTDVLVPDRVRGYREYSRGGSSMVRDVLTRMYRMFT